MKKVFYIFSGLMISALFVACGGNNSSNNNNGAINIQCPPNTAFVNGYCQGANGIVNTNSVGFYSENTKTRSMQVNGGMTAFLRDAMGVCDREKISGGGASCMTWMNGAFDMVIQSPTTQLSGLVVTFRAARPATGAYSDYSYSLPSGGAFLGMMLGMPVPNNPAAARPTLQLTMNTELYNNSQGFVATGWGAMDSRANRSAIRIQVPQGKLESNVLPYRVLLNEQQVMTGQLIRCNTADCGLSRPVGY